MKYQGCAATVRPHAHVLNGPMNTREAATRISALHSAAVRLSLSLILLTLAACSTNDPRFSDLPPSADWQEQQVQLRALQHWQANGKLALRSAEGSQSGTVRWQQDGTTTEVNLSGPLGIGGIRIESDGETLLLHREGNIEEIDISSADAILRSTGWDLPLPALPHWLKGLPAPDAEIETLELDESSRYLIKLQQSGWHIRYERYGTFGALTLPTRIVLRGPESKATVLVRQWHTPP